MSLKDNLWHFLYNLDRAVASLFGAPPQETISSETGRAAKRGDLAGKIGCDILDDIQKGHCEDAIVHADILDAADNGKEK